MIILERLENGRVRIKSRDRWQDWFYFTADVRFIRQGEKVPFWYLPIKSYYGNDGHIVECWLIPLAPWVALAYVLIAQFRGAWVQWFLFVQKQTGVRRYARMENLIFLKTYPEEVNDEEA